MYRAVVSAANHPDPYNPYLGLFNFRSIRALTDTGVDATVVAPRPFAPPIGPYASYREIPEYHAFDSHAVRYPRFAYLLPQRLFRYTLSSASVARRLPAYLEKHVEPPDICHAGHIHYDGYALLPYCRRHDIPLTVMGRGKLLNDYQELPRRGRRKIRETLTYASGVYCVSQSLADIAADLVDPAKVSVLPNGANPERYPVACTSAIKRELGIPGDTAVVLFCGGYTERKGIHEIVAALDHIPHEDVKLVFVGHYGDLRPNLLQALTRSEHTGYEVLWKVPPLALRRWLTVADILIVPSHAEGRPNTVYEAMASETAVVGTDVSGIPEQVRAGETGLLIPPKDPTALADALADLLATPKRRAEMGLKGRERLVEKGWTWDAHGERLASHHETIVEQTGR